MGRNLTGVIIDSRFCGFENKRITKNVGG